MKKKKFNTGAFKAWSLTFTKWVITIVTAVWVAMTIYEAVMIYMAVDLIQNFSYLDTFIVEVNKTFCVIVGANLIKACIENVFRYNPKLGGSSVYPEDTSAENEIEEGDVG